ncbi:MAG: TonB-dependent receptor [Pseudomonadota bacterium]
MSVDVLAQSATVADDGELEEILVTGSRIRNVNLSGAAPVTVLDAEAIKVTGNVSIGDVLQDLTVNANGINVQANNGGDGTTRVNLRGVGSARTLVLVNGRRHVLASQGTNWSVDLNAIPLSVVERVEVVKDGASAVYGSDAIAGVVNIITKTELEGIELNAFAGQSGESDGEIVDLNLTLGVTSDRGSMMLSTGFYEQEPIMAGDRGFSRFDKDYDWTANDGSFTAAGSTAPPQGAIWDRNPDLAGNEAWQALVGASTGSIPLFYNDPANGWRDFNLSGTSDVGSGDFYNYQPENYLLTPQKRWNIYGAGQYSVSDSAELYIEGSYINRQSEQLLAPTPLFTITEGITVDAENFYNPFGRDLTDVRRRFVEASNRFFRQDIDTYRAVVGLRGDIGAGALSGWSWDAYLNYGRTQGVSLNEGRFVRSRVIEAIGPSFVDESGTLRCGTAQNPGSAGCVPLDLFGGAGNRPVTADQLAWISYVGVDDLVATQKTVAFNLSGSIAELPAGPLGLAFGGEYREEDGSNTPDPITNSGDTTGNKAERTAGGYDVVDIYAELGVPILERLQATAAVRYSDYSNFGDTTNGKVGLIWDVTDSLTLRGTVSQAFRAPTIPELFLGSSDDFPNVTDPCDTSDEPRTPSQQATCSADGLPDDYGDNRGQLPSTLGGNEELEPEVADTWTLGVVYQPKWFEGAAVTVDAWNIEIEDSIQSITAGVILSSCYNQGLENRQYCDRISRTGTGFLDDIDDRNTNIGGVDAAGIDVTFTYAHDTRFGTLNYSIDYAYLDEYTETQADGRRINGRGVYDLGVFAKNKVNANLRWNRGPWSANYNVRWIDGFRECEDNDCSGTGAVSRKVEDNWQNDVQFSYDFVQSRSKLSQLTLGIQNLFDEEPSVIFNGFLATSDSNTYDFLGRFMYLSYRHSL